MPWLFPELEYKSRHESSVRRSNSTLQFPQGSRFGSLFAATSAYILKPSLRDGADEDIDVICTERGGSHRNPTPRTSNKISKDLSHSRRPNVRFMRLGARPNTFTESATTRTILEPTGGIGYVLCKSACTPDGLPSLTSPAQAFVYHIHKGGIYVIKS